MAGKGTIESWNVHYGLFATVEPRSELKFCYDADQHKIGKQIIRIRNEAGSDDHVTYKIKTTGPNRFRVNPCTGILSKGGAEAAVEIQPNLSVTPDVSVFNEERFLVCMMPLRPMPSTQDALLKLWAEPDAMARADTHIINVSIMPITDRKEEEESPARVTKMADFILQDAHLHEAKPHNRRAEQDPQCSDGLCSCPVKRSTVISGQNLNREGSRHHSSAAVSQPFQDEGDPGSEFLTPRSTSRNYTKDGQSHDTSPKTFLDGVPDRPYCRDTQYPPCDPNMVSPYCDPAPCVPWVRIVVVLTMFIGVSIWNAIQAMTPPPLTWTEWFLKKLDF